MKSSRYLVGRILLAIGGLATAWGDAAAAPVASEHIQSELLAEPAAAAPGSEAVFGLRLTPETGWHVYWRNPGDSGLPTRILWTLPAGASAGEIQWPYPATEVLGDIVNYGYAEASTLLVPVHVPSDWPVGKPLPVAAEAKWLVCKDICIPGSAKYSLSLPVAAESTPDPAQVAVFADARAHLPRPMPAEWKAQFAIAGGAADGGTFSLGIAGLRLAAGSEVAFYPVDKELVNHSAPQRVAREVDSLRLSQPLNSAFAAAPEKLAGVLVVKSPDETRAYEVEAQPGSVAAVAATAAATSAAAAPAAPVSTLSLSSALLFAFLGGLILNLMPCVFPVLSLKALAVAQAGGQGAAHRQRDALAYTGGVLVSFLAVAAVLMLLRAGGSAFGWGFQLQSPTVVALLAEVMFALGLSMSGVAMFGTSLMGAGQSLASREGVSGAFFTGVLAAVVASPCSAPFMGTALGFALTQPPLIAATIFVSLGLGMALPFLLIGFVPQLARALPKPGAWMETFKQVLAFPLYLTAAWLVWVLARQTGPNGAGVALVALVMIGFGLWLVGLYSASAWPRRIGWLVVAAAAALCFTPPMQAQAVATAEAAEHEPFSEARLAELRAQHKPVFVNLTADWCLTCKVNEHGALAAGSVRKAFADKGVVWLEGDWTRYDPAITQVLEHFGRSGVPLYLVYGADGGEPQVLPQILTPELVAEAVARAN